MIGPLPQLFDKKQHERVKKKIGSDKPLKGMPWSTEGEYAQWWAKTFANINTPHGRDLLEESWAYEANPSGYRRRKRTPQRLDATTRGTLLGGFSGVSGAPYTYRKRLLGR